MIIFKTAAALLTIGFLDASQCASSQQTADQQATAQQETMEQQAQDQVGMPNIVRFREKRTLKLVEELADEGIGTFVYLYNPFHNCFQYLGPGFGYPIPYATQYTNPQKMTDAGGQYTTRTPIAQADPNGLFKPAAAAGTWVLMKDPIDGNLKPQYIEDNVETFTFRMSNECKASS